MQYTEDEFLQTLDWKPHAKADYHICRKQQTQEDEKYTEPGRDDNGVNLESNDDTQNGNEADNGEYLLTADQVEEFHFEETT